MTGTALIFLVITVRAGGCHGGRNLSSLISPRLGKGGRILGPGGEAQGEKHPPQGAGRTRKRLIHEPCGPGGIVTLPIRQTAAPRRCQRSGGRLSPPTTGLPRAACPAPLQALISCLERCLGGRPTLWRTSAASGCRSCRPTASPAPRRARPPPWPAPRPNPGRTG